MPDDLYDDERIHKGFGRRCERTFSHIAVGSLVGNLPELVLAHFLSDKRVALIIDLGRNRYVQFLATEDQHLVVECVSNRFLAPGDELSIESELTLMDIGFELPGADGDPHPNWWWHTEEIVEVMTACRMAASVLYGVFGLTDESRGTLTERPLAVNS